jgi:hypothetical protein
MYHICFPARLAGKNISAAFGRDTGLSGSNPGGGTKGGGGLVVFVFFAGVEDVVACSTCDFLETSQYGLSMTITISSTSSLS